MSLIDVLISVVVVIGLIAVDEWLKARRAQHECDPGQYRDGHRDGYKAAMDILEIGVNMRFREGYADGYESAMRHMDKWAKGVHDNPDDDDDFDPLDDTAFDHDDDDDFEQAENVQAVAEAIFPKAYRFEAEKRKDGTHWVVDCLLHGEYGPFDTESEAITRRDELRVVHGTIKDRK